MRKGKHLHPESPSARKRGYKSLALILAVVLVVFGIVDGTVAWLTADTDPVVNTFTYGDIDLELKETKTDENGTPVDADGDGSPDKTDAGNSYEMVPGKEYLKDPAVTVLAGNEACWLFVKLEEKGGVTVTNADGSTTTYDFRSYLTYAVADGWNQLVDDTGAVMEGIYFRYVGEDTDDIGITYEVLEGNKISVPDAVTKDMLNALDNNGQDADGDGEVDENNNYPTLSITAYAVQYSGFEAEVSEEATGPTAAQLNAAALPAWRAVETQNTTANP